MSDLLVMIGLTSVASIYGAWHLIAKAAMAEGTSPYLFLFYRCFLGSALMMLTLCCIPAARSRADKPFYPVSEIVRCLRSDGDKFFLLACLLGLNTIGGLMAVARLPAIVCAIFQPILPVIAAVMSTLLGIEPWSTGKAICICVCTMGATIVIVSGHELRVLGLSSSSSTQVGWLFLAVNITAGAAYSVVQKQCGVLRNYSPIFVAGVSFLIAACGILPSACYSAPTAKDWLCTDRLITQMALAYAAVFVTAYNYSVSAWANKISSPTTVVAFQTLQPVATCCLNYAVYGLHLTFAQALGGSAIVAGLLADVLWKNGEASHHELRPLKGMPILVK
mmetsp:Transcript_18223/g.42725  ORF Transcript_18223/g.42725 Transcript_18223/m.42725 type:complete len:335 (+) Transcript_18223:179-1183(+)